MKKLALATAALILSTGLFTSCKQEATLKIKPPVQQYAGFKKDISTAD